MHKYFISFDVNDSDYNKDVTLMKIGADGVYKIDISDFYKNDNDGKTRKTIIRRLKWHDAFAEEKTILKYLDSATDWTPITCFYIIRLRGGDKISIITEGIILDGEEYGQFTIKKIGS